MGYDIHITRAVPFYLDHRYPIAASEVRSLVRDTADLVIPDDQAAGSFQILVGDDSWLAFTGGRLHTKNPGDPMIRRMIEIATALDAWVAGDEDEIYTWENGEVTSDEADLPEITPITLDRPVTAEEWAAHVAATPDLDWFTRVEAVLPSGRRWIDCPPVACWTGHPGGRPVPFFVDEAGDGAIEVEEPDDLTLARMRLLFV
ncbi:hypothetical protein [Actinoplanes subglobosus]|uniref:Uncharacterized protein n=1 Tax=Actinoplanes subglobosus TaxID=1547892 RepID=A0ABV8IVV4_9ACTN